MRFLRLIGPLVICLSLPASTLGSKRSALREKVSFKDEDEKSGGVEGERLLQDIEGGDGNEDEVLVIANDDSDEGKSVTARRADICDREVQAADEYCGCMEMSYDMSMSYSFSMPPKGSKSSKSSKSSKGSKSSKSSKGYDCGRYESKSGKSSKSSKPVAAKVSTTAEDGLFD